MGCAWAVCCVGCAQCVQHAVYMVCVHSVYAVCVCCVCSVHGICYVCVGCWRVQCVSSLCDVYGECVAHEEGRSARGPAVLRWGGLASGCCPPPSLPQAPLAGLSLSGVRVLGHGRVLLPSVSGPGCAVCPSSQSLWKPPLLAFWEGPRDHLAGPG